MSDFFAQFNDVLSELDRKYLSEATPANLSGMDVSAAYVVMREVWQVLRQLIFEGTYNIQVVDNLLLRVNRLQQLSEGGYSVSSIDLPSNNAVPAIVTDLPKVCQLCKYELKARLCPSRDTVKIVCQGCGQEYIEYTIEPNGGLRECPYCMSDTLTIDYNEATEEHYVWCGKCGAYGPTGKTREEAIAVWNRRGKHED